MESLYADGETIVQRVPIMLLKTNSIPSLRAINHRQAMGKLPFFSLISFPCVLLCYADYLIPLDIVGTSYLFILLVYSYIVHKM